MRLQTSKEQGVDSPLTVCWCPFPAFFLFFYAFSCSFVCCPDWLLFFRSAFRSGICRNAGGLIPWFRVESFRVLGIFCPTESCAHKLGSMICRNRSFLQTVKVYRKVVKIVWTESFGQKWKVCLHPVSEGRHGKMIRKTALEKRVWKDESEKMSLKKPAWRIRLGCRSAKRFRSDLDGPEMSQIWHAASLTYRRSGVPPSWNAVSKVCRRSGMSWSWQAASLACRKSDLW